MEPIYFPFTTISPLALAKIRIWDAPPVLYAPTNADVLPDITAMADTGLLSLRIPVIAEDDKLQKLVKAYGDWARQHIGDAGGMAAFKAAHGDGVPFFDDTYIASIRSAIKTPPAGRQSQAKKTEHLFRARLFLLIAQQFDVQNDGLDRDFDTLAQMERSLFDELKGVDKQLNIDAVHKEDRGAQMTSERLSAWNRLFLADKPTSPPTTNNLFVTDSPAVFDYLQELIPTLKTVFTLKETGIFIGDDSDTALRRNQFNTFLKTLAGQPDIPVPEQLAPKNVSSIAKNKCALTIAVAPFMSPATFSQSCISAKAGTDIPLFPDQRHQSTLIGVVT